MNIIVGRYLVDINVYTRQIFGWQQSQDHPDLVVSLLEDQMIDDWHWQWKKVDLINQELMISPRTCCVLFFRRSLSFTFVSSVNLFVPPLFSAILSYKNSTHEFHAFHKIRRETLDGTSENSFRKQNLVHFFSVIAWFHWKCPSLVPTSFKLWRRTKALIIFGLRRTKSSGEKRTMHVG